MEKRDVSGKKSRIVAWGILAIYLSVLAAVVFAVQFRRSHRLPLDLAHLQQMRYHSQEARN